MRVSHDVSVNGRERVGVVRERVVILRLTQVGRLFL